MNILFVTGMFAQNEQDTGFGGMIKAVCNSAIGMKGRGHRVRVLTASNRDRHWYYRGLEVFSVRAANDMGDENAINILGGIIKREHCIEKKINELNEKEAIDIIQYTGWYGVGLFHKKTIPAVMRISTYTKVQLANNYCKGKKIILSLLEYSAAKRMNFVFAPSRILADGVQRDIKKM